MAAGSLPLEPPPVPGALQAVSSMAMLSVSAAIRVREMRLMSSSFLSYNGISKSQANYSNLLIFCQTSALFSYFVVFSPVDKGIPSVSLLKIAAHSAILPNFHFPFIELLYGAFRKFSSLFKKTIFSKTTIQTVNTKTAKKRRGFPALFGCPVEFLLFCYTL